MKVCDKMNHCQKNFLLNRIYDNAEQSVTYLCHIENCAIKIDVSDLMPNDIKAMDKKALESISHHCQQCVQKNCQQDILGK